MPETPRVLATTIVSERVDSLREHPQNPRQGDLGAVIEAITANGYIVPVVAQTSTRIVIDGNHRLKAARSLGMVEIPVVWVNVDDDTALRHLLAANRTNDLASWDESALAAILTDLAQQTEQGTVGTAWDADAHDDILARLAAPVTTATNIAPDVEGQVICPSCGARFVPKTRRRFLGRYAK